MAEPKMAPVGNDLYTPLTPWIRISGQVRYSGPVLTESIRINVANVA
jgi:hypothetical protein